MRSIEITFTPLGEVTIEAIGFKGKACEAATKAIEQALGAVTTRKAKPELYQATTQQKQRT